MHSVIGIGLNVNQVDFENNKSTSLYKETNKKLNIKSLVFEYISFFNQTMNDFQKQGEKNIHHIFDNHLWLKGEESRFIRDNETFTGIITDTDITGQINIEVDGALQSYKNGEIKFANRLE
jgi:BirA family biotin operon repressor/biotin-[acetyl-CoA-carboxylase] ligase